MRLKRRCRNLSPASALSTRVSKDSLDEVWDYLGEVVAALGYQYQQAVSTLASSPPAFPQYSGLSDQDLADHFRLVRDELDAEVVLALVCAAEGEVRRDFRRRTSARLKGELSRKWRQLPARGGWVRFEEILSAWRASGRHKKTIDEFEKLYRHRHWLAHGRYFPNKCGLPTVTPQVAYGLSADLLQRLSRESD